MSPLGADRPLHNGFRACPAYLGDSAGYRDDMTDEEVEAVCAAGPMVDFVPFDLAFTEIMSLGGRGDSGRSPLVLLPEAGSALVIDLAERLTEAMIGQGFDPRAFQPKLPHLTLLYESKRIDKTPLPTPIRVRVDGFALIQSHRGETRYTRLWPGPELLDGNSGSMSNG